MDRPQSLSRKEFNFFRSPRDIESSGERHCHQQEPNHPGDRLQRPPGVIRQREIGLRQEVRNALTPAPVTPTALKPRGRRSQRDWTSTRDSQRDRTLTRGSQRAGQRGGEGANRAATGDRRRVKSPRTRQRWGAKLALELFGQRQDLTSTRGLQRISFDIAMRENNETVITSGTIDSYCSNSGGSG